MNGPTASVRTKDCGDRSSLQASRDQDANYLVYGRYDALLNDKVETLQKGYNHHQAFPWCLATIQSSFTPMRPSNASTFLLSKIDAPVLSFARSRRPSSISPAALPTVFLEVELAKSFLESSMTRRRSCGPD